ncbi:MAG: bifunctional DNA-formamidopyrimidine glycosylase/DNA-(apurinic or apyrimidinic site) lyase [Patescibacteria group bacterium]
MTELPEVETIRLGLKKHLVGHTILDIVITLPKQFRGDPKLITGAKVSGARKFGKGLVIDFSNNMSLAIHVKMTGQLLYKPAKDKESEIGLQHFSVPQFTQSYLKNNQGVQDANEKNATSFSQFSLEDLPDKYTHVIFHLDRGAVLYYRDIRQFGWIQVVPTEEVAFLPFFKSLGKEPLRDLTLKDFKTILKATRSPIKTVLMDQRRIAGVGNIYANDALFQAGILPTRSASSLSPSEQQKLFVAIEALLTKSIALGGASANNYISVLGTQGNYQKHFLVYKKDGQACPLCGTIIQRCVLGGRGTFFCSSCQC